MRTELLIIFFVKSQNIGHSLLFFFYSLSIFCHRIREYKIKTYTLKNGKWSRAPLGPCICVTNDIFINLALSVCANSTQYEFIVCQQLLSGSRTSISNGIQRKLFLQIGSKCAQTPCFRIYCMSVLFFFSHFLCLSLARSFDIFVAIIFLFYFFFVCHFNVTSTHLLAFAASAEQIKQTPEMFVACFGLFLYNFRSYF